MSDANDDSNPVGLIGKTLGRYRITAELGRGGMATVYRATDPQLGRDVAIKVMHGTFTGRGDIEKRFRREAQAVAAIKHDSIVDIFDFAPGGQGEPGYIVTEIIEGPTLRELMDQCGGKILPEPAALLAARVAGALGAAHSHGIIHRDVKPDNIMVDRRAGAAVRVVLTDFGVAHIIEGDTMTATGSILGSPAYMSPEQARGQDVGPQSDVFALGVLLYHLVTGRTPFSGKDPLTMIAAILTGELMRPSQIDAHVSPAMEAIIMRCLKRTPAERYPDANALFVALRKFADDSGLTDEPAGLRAFLDDRDNFERGLKTRVAEQALDSARRCARRGELSRALAEVNRVFAYHPKHSGAEALLAKIASRRRWTKVAVIAAAGLVLAAGGYGATRIFQTLPEPSPAAAPPLAAQPTMVPAPPPPVTPPASPPPSSSPSAPSPSAAAVKPEPRRKPAPRVRAPQPPKPTPPPPPSETVAAPAISAPPAPSVVPSSPEPSTTASTSTSTTVAPERPAARLVIRASQGFCSPSMDDHPAKIAPVYEGATPGTHRIYCTMPGGPKLLVGTYDLRPGTRPNLVIVPGPDGKPMLGRRE